jgi:hypothetical protein
MALLKIWQADQRPRGEQTPTRRATTLGSATGDKAADREGLERRVLSRARLFANFDVVVCSKRATGQQGWITAFSAWRHPLGSYAQNPKRRAAVVRRAVVQRGAALTPNERRRVTSAWAQPFTNISEHFSLFFVLVAS